jgi:hypothetical protein
MKTKRTPFRQSDKPGESEKRAKKGGDRSIPAPRGRGAARRPRRSARG